MVTSGARMRPKEDSIMSAHAESASYPRVPNGWRKTALARRLQGWNVTYDFAGNQKTLPQRTFSYDAENRVTSATEPNSSLIGYVYDGEGKRVQRTVGTAV